MVDEPRLPERPDLNGQVEGTGGTMFPDTADVVGVVKVAGTVVWRAVTSITKGSVDAVNELAREVQAGEPITHIVDHQVAMAQSAVLQALGIAANGQAGPVAPGRRASSERDLRAIGTAMLKDSWQASNQPRGEHPSFALMLQSLTPDEARILRFLAVAGPQPAIDIRTKTPFGVGSERLAGGINLIAEMAGCTWPERDRHYLANLNRLGLVRFSEEPVTDRRRYAFVEAQPKATEPMERVKKAKTIYRSIYLSLFGEQFCEICFDLEGYDAGGWAGDDRGDKIIGKGARQPKKKKHH
jgi:DNA-binding MarR family transcriptional regulator